MSERKIIVDPHLLKTSDAGGKLWIPINKNILARFEAEISKVANLQDVITLIKSDLGLVLMILKYEYFYRALVERSQLDKIPVSREDLNNFLSIVYGHQYFDLHELHEVQISTIKIASIFSSLHDLVQERDFFAAVRPLLPYVYFTFYTPTWFEKSLKRAEGNFEDILLRGMDSGPIKSTDVEKYFKVDQLVDQPLLECFEKFRPLLSLSSSAEPELFYETASRIDEHLVQAQKQGFKISEERFEQQLHKWQLQWSVILPKKFCRIFTVKEIKDTAKRIRGVKLLERHRNSLKILEASDDILSEFLSEVKNQQPSVEAIKILFEKIIPAVGFNLAIVYLSDSEGKLLVPKVKFGSAKTLNIPVITMSKFSREEEAIVDALSNSRVVKIDEGNLLGIDGSFFVIPFSYEKHRGVFIVGTEPEDPRSVTIEALKSAQTCANLLGLALGYS